MSPTTKNTSNGFMTTCIKRCNAEMLELYENHYNLINVIKLHLDKNEMHFIIEKNNGTVLKFLLSNKYPFQEPKLLINNYYYNRNVLQNPSSAKISNLFKKYKINCMCCCSIICHKNWSPAYRIKNVLDEIEEVNIIKRYVKQFLIMDEICIMKNIDTDTIGMYILDFVSDNPFIGAYLFCKTD
jgi:ubiquitin-protein ligase